MSSAIFECLVLSQMEILSIWDPELMEAFLKVLVKFCIESSS
jgi:hypothetical protein